MNDLTQKQAKVLEFIKDYLAKNYMPPTHTEIGEKFRFTPNGAKRHLVALQKKGVIRLIPNISRGIRVVAP